MSNLPGTLYVLAAPSGAGKTSLVNRLIEKDQHVKLSISYTTRLKRPGEQDGVHYFFIDDAEFVDMISKEIFLEHAMVFDHYYGTSSVWVEEQLNAGYDVVLEIDWQGAQQIREKMPESIGIFILPPAKEALRQRLQARQQDAAEVIQKRLKAAVSEMQHYDEFDYIVINEDFEEALSDILSIMKAQRLRCSRQIQAQTARLAELLETE